MARCNGSVFILKGVGGSQRPVTECVDVVLYSCNHCGRKYKTLYGLNKHQSSHEQSGENHFISHSLQKPRIISVPVVLIYKDFHCD